MKKKLNCVLLVDDDDDCNFFHQRILNKMGCTEKIEVATNGQEALDFLLSTENGKHPQPSIIFLDINMPVMNGWEFLSVYETLKDDQKAKIVLVMLTTSLNPDDKERALKSKYVDDFQTKYLDKQALSDILKKHFPDQF